MSPHPPSQTRLSYWPVIIILICYHIVILLNDDTMILLYDTMILLYVITIILVYDQIIVKILVHSQDSCACTTLLCMQSTLVHALEGPGPKAGTQKECWGSGLGQRSFWVRALGPGPSSACTRVLCMHKSVVHAQESCACTRILMCLTIFPTFLGTSWYVFSTYA